MTSLRLPYSFSFLFSILIVIKIHKTESHGYSCLDENGETVDWFIAVKQPKSLKYMYFTSAKPDKWISIANANITNDGPVYKTLQRAKAAENRKDTLVFMYNDEPPLKSRSSTSRGIFNAHMKGLVVYNTSYTGFWLIHSWPKYPSLQTRKGMEASPKYGQSFLCVSTAMSEIGEIGHQIYLAGANCYNNFTLDKEFLKLKESKYWKKLQKRERDAKSLQKYRTKAIKTAANKTQFIHFSKTELFRRDIYSDLIATYLKSSLLVETWRMGEGGVLNSTCDAAYTVENVDEYYYKLPNKTSEEYRYTHDHAKWAISKTNGRYIVCIGDINRMESQTHRGGGALCFENKKAYKNFKSLIAKTEECPAVSNLSMEFLIILAIIMTTFIVFTITYFSFIYIKRRGRDQYQEI